MSKFTEAIRAALAKKHAAHHPDAKEDEHKSKQGRTPVLSHKPQKKVTGRGR